MTRLARMLSARSCLIRKKTSLGNFQLSSARSRLLLGRDSTLWGRYADLYTEVGSGVFHQPGSPSIETYSVDDQIKLQLLPGDFQLLPVVVWLALFRSRSSSACLSPLYNPRHALDTVLISHCRAVGAAFMRGK